MYEKILTQHGDFACAKTQVVFPASSTKEMALHLWLFIMLKKKPVVSDQGRRTRKKRLNYAKMLAFAVAEGETETQSREKLKQSVRM